MKEPELVEKLTVHEIFDEPVSYDYFLTEEGQLASKRKPDGVIDLRERKEDDGSIHPYIVPTWCGMSPREHACAWGCMSVLTGLVAKRGRDNCKTCEFYTPENGETFTVETPELKSEEDFHSYELGLDDRSFERPTHYPCKVIFHHKQGVNEWGQKRFRTTTEITYV